MDGSLYGASGSFYFNFLTGAMWINCELLQCFYQLFGLILTTPIRCRGSIGEQVMC